MTEFATSEDGVRIAFEASGEGAPALVFVHGWSCDRSYWAGQVSAFAREFKVVTVEYAGHGASGRGRSTWTMGAFGADVAAVVEQLHLEPVVLIGHSMGGDVIVEAARRLPGRVSGLVWADAHTQLHTSYTPQEVQTVMAPFRARFVETTRSYVRRLFPHQADRALVEQVAADMSAAPPEVALGTLESKLNFDREILGALKDVKLPVIAINPDHEPTDIASLERNGIEVVLMPGVGHFLMMEDPGRFNQLLRSAIRKLSR